jgi:hypothetical protein
LNALEHYWVSDYYNHKKHPDSLNLRAGGNHPGTSEEIRLKISKSLLEHSGHQYTQEERNKISKGLKGHLGHQFTDEERAKMSKTKKGCQGHPHTEDEKHKLSIAHKGTKHSEDAKKKMRESRRRFLLLHPEARYNGAKGKRVICLETGEIFRSSYAANKAYPNAACGTILQCCNKIKHYNTAGGFHWAFFEENYAQL